MIVGAGVHYLDGAIECPFAGVATRGPRASNRLAIDDRATEARIDHDARRIVITNTREYPHQTLLGDFMTLGRGRTKDGETRFAVHVRFDKKGSRVRARPHLHPTARARLVSWEIDPYEVVVSNGRREIVALSRALADRAVKEPTTSDWVGRALLTIRHVEPRARGAVAHLVVAIGVGPLRRDVLALEVRLGDGGTAETKRDLRGGALEALLGAATWELRLTSLANAPALREYVSRAMFLLGLDDLPALARVARDGLPKGESLVFRVRDGEARVELGAKGEAIPSAMEVVRAYLEYDFVGAIVAAELGGEAAAASGADVVV